MDEWKHEWQNEKFLPENERKRILQITEARYPKIGLVFPVVFAVIALVLIISAICIYSPEKDNWIYLLGTSLFPIGIAGPGFYFFIDGEKLKKILQTRNFVFAKEQIQSIEKNNIINHIKTIFLDDDILLGREERKIVIFIRESPSKKTTYCFFSLDCLDETEKKKDE